ncbi:MAG TPA: cytochrome d ubiquinol oxidase subunit II [Bryobacteraceae bacterium]|nr:cytochrome d ubiquinol oxidase subunit II [Bryobacteraceae bacterium]
METLWFWLVAVMIAAYVVLDGFDLGAGIIYLFVARNDAERGSVLRSIGPFWDGNEVWLLAAGGTLYFAFPVLYASSFSGFYLPLMIVLWLLILRGLSLELRGHVDADLWKQFADAVFALSSGLLAIFFGAALANVIRGVPLDAEGYFFLPLWTNFTPQREAGILDWYTIPIGLAAFVTLMFHGALWVACKTEGEVRERSIAIANRLRWAVLALLGLVLGLSAIVQPRMARGAWMLPLALIALAVAGWIGKTDLTRFLASSGYIVAMLVGAVLGVYPNVLPSNGDPQLSLTIYNASAAHYGLSIGLRWFIPGIALAAGYFFYVYRMFAGKVRAEGPGY